MDWGNRLKTEFPGTRFTKPLLGIRGLMGSGSIKMTMSLNMNDAHLEQTDVRHEQGTSSKGDCERVGCEVGGNKLRKDFYEKGMEKGI